MSARDGQWSDELDAFLDLTHMPPYKVLDVSPGWLSFLGSHNVLRGCTLEEALGGRGMEAQSLQQLYTEANRIQFGAVHGSSEPYKCSMVFNASSGVQFDVHLALSVRQENETRGLQLRMLHADVLTARAPQRLRNEHAGNLAASEAAGYASGTVEHDERAPKPPRLRRPWKQTQLQSETQVAPSRSESRAPQRLRNERKGRPLAVEDVSNIPYDDDRAPAAPRLRRPFKQTHSAAAGAAAALSDALEQPMKVNTTAQANGASMDGTVMSILLDVSVDDNGVSVVHS